ncbi:Predicted arabinose efflux permease, MFS family [Alkalicoccus daliensis]|uniref:Predicted arabinose efflux permease, MFS family n=2 Tax=Alkalicoccus daliensis TaxID=745820 RepID=A0A1H0APW5_9BACI|nr:MFS transporter [Alkalicoccus daliensis]SDN35394.1 Predicted arabinose efflux permease, MFS family [Alkalicoccus daliensis]
MTNKNLTVMWIANFFVAASATMILPFLSVYIETFGDYPADYVQRWSGIIFGVTFLVAFIVAPLWGRFGDKFGRKKILLLTGYGIAVSILLMSFVSTVWELFLLRMFMGVVTGFIPTSMALISAQTNKEEAGKVLGTLQMGTVSGGLFGPLLGGILADSIGFTYTFLITFVVIALATSFVALGIKEVKPADVNTEKYKRSMKEVVILMLRNRMLLMVMVLSLVVQTANFSIQPQLALYVGELTQAENVAFLAGMAFSATGLGNLAATRFWGIRGDKMGHDKIILICLILSAAAFLPQAFVTSIWQLVILRFLFGLALGGIIPCATAYIRQTVPIEVQGEVLGYNQSFRFLGNVTGPVAGGFIAGSFSIASVFYSSTILLTLMAVIFYIVYRTKRNFQKGRNMYAFNIKRKKFNS